MKIFLNSSLLDYFTLPFALSAPGLPELFALFGVISRGGFLKIWK